MSDTKTNRSRIRKFLRGVEQSEFHLKKSKDCITVIMVPLWLFKNILTHLRLYSCPELVKEMNKLEESKFVRFPPELTAAATKKLEGVGRGDLSELLQTCEQKKVFWLKLIKGESVENLPFPNPYENGYSMHFR